MTGEPVLYVENMEKGTAGEYGRLVEEPTEADLAILRLRTPYEPGASKFESFFHSGRLDFPEEQLKRILDLLDTVPTIVCVNLERAAVLPEIAERAAALVADYGASDAALLDVVFGRAKPEGRLPFELPRSMKAVEASKPDVPDDTVNPLFPCGAGLPVRTTPGRPGRPLGTPMDAAVGDDAAADARAYLRIQQA